MKQSESQVRGYISNIQRYSIHDGPGIRTTVFFKGCPLRCGWCSNPETQKLLPEEMMDLKQGKKVITGEEKSVEDVIEIVCRDKVFYQESNGGITLSGGEALLQPEFARAILDTASACGIHTAIETTGFAEPCVFEQVADGADLILFDIKGIDEEKHIMNTGVSNKRILENLRAAAEKKRNVTVRIPVIPCHNATTEELQKIVDYSVSVGINRLELLPYHRLGEPKYRRLGRKYRWEGIPILTGEELKMLKSSLMIPDGVELMII